MEEIIMINGFQQTENPNEYVKGYWTIRLDGDLIEVFNDPDKQPGKYYIYPINKIDIHDLLNEIKSLI